MADNAADNSSDQEGWSGVAKDVAGTSESGGFFATLFALIRHPVRATLLRAEDPAYTQHVKFFTTCFGVWLAVGLIVIPKLVTWYTGEVLPDYNQKSTIISLSILQYLQLAVSIPLSFYLYRLGATRTRSPRSYFKFALIGAGLALVMSVAMQVARILAIIAIRETLREDLAASIVQSPALIMAVNALVMVAPVVLAIILNRAFWNLRWRFVIPVALAILAIELSVLLAAIQVLSTDGAQALIAKIADFF